MSGGSSSVVYGQFIGNVEVGLPFIDWREFVVSGREGEEGWGVGFWTGSETYGT